MIEELNITRLRTETRPETIPLTDPESGDPIDLDGAVVRMAINAKKDPTDTDLPEFEMYGVPSATPDDGLATFTPTQEDADRAGEFYFDVRVTLASGIVVYPVKGQWWILENVTEAAAPGELWKPDPDAIDGSEVSTDGSEFWLTYIPKPIPVLRIEYATRDGVKVISITTDLSATSNGPVFVPFRSPLCNVPPLGVYEYTYHCYLGGAQPAAVGLFFGDGTMSFYNEVTLFDLDEVDVYLQVREDGIPVDYYDYAAGIGLSPGWVTFKAQTNPDAGEMKVKVWQSTAADASSGEPAGWQMEGTLAPLRLGPSMAQFWTSVAIDSICELASFRWERTG